MLLDEALVQAKILDIFINLCYLILGTGKLLMFAILRVTAGLSFVYFSLRLETTGLEIDHGRRWEAEKEGQEGPEIQKQLWHQGS